MGMGRREKQRRQEGLWIVHTELPRTVAHPFYEQLNRVLEARHFDEWVVRQCAHFYAEKMGRPSLAPGRYFRLLLIGYFEGIDSERGIAWRAADSLALRSFLGVGLNEMPPDHSTISRTRLIGVAVRFIPRFAHIVTVDKRLRLWPRRRVRLKNGIILHYFASYACADSRQFSTNKGDTV